MLTLLFTLYIYLKLPCYLLFSSQYLVNLIYGYFIYYIFLYAYTFVEFTSMVNKYTIQYNSSDDKSIAIEDADSEDTDHDSGDEEILVKKE